MTRYQPTRPGIAWTHQPHSPRRTRHHAWPKLTWPSRRKVFVPRPA